MKNFSTFVSLVKKKKNEWGLCQEAKQSKAKQSGWTILGWHRTESAWIQQVAAFSVPGTESKTQGQKANGSEI